MGGCTRSREFGFLIRANLSIPMWLIEPFGKCERRGAAAI
jgi:hypothetical protein